MQTAPISQPPPYLHGLNPAQAQAVEALDGPVLVLAGAGTGKTRVLTTRLAHLLRTGRAYPSQILAVTFTNKAAQEMRTRVSALLNGQGADASSAERGAGADLTSGWWLGTFHALAARMLRRHAELAGLTSAFTIIDQDDSVRLIKQLMEAEGIDVKKFAPKAAADRISFWKDKARVPSSILSEEAGEFAGGKIIKIYSAYQQRLKALNACDFGDLLLHVLTLLKDPKNADILADYHRRFRYIMVDEYQDTNVAQYMWLRLLAQGSNNICCVGDDDQSIYGWRGAEVGNILRFEKDFPGAKIIRLEQNYRSTKNILAAANAVIAHNEGRLGKELFTAIEEGEKVVVKGLWDGEAEARWAGEEIESLQNKKWPLNQIAILVRAGFQTREFEERMIQLGLPYTVIGGPRFYERMEVRDALAYLRVVAQPQDDLALERIINTPKRGIGDTTVQILQSHARARGISLYQSIADLTQTDELKPKVRAVLLKLYDDLERWRGLSGGTPHSDLSTLILDESGYMDMWRAEKTPDAAGRIENLKELVAGMEEFESLSLFLEHVSLVMENQGKEGAESLTIMTLHAAKGLEYDAVFLAGWEEGLFPSQRSMDEHGIKGLEEERRLAYVGITRARKRSYISFAANRRMYGQWINAIPSRFIAELPQNNITMHSDIGGYDTGRSRYWDSSGFQMRQRTATPVASSPRQVEASTGQVFSTGGRVRHEKFGGGTIVHIDGHKLDIQFDSGGMKRVMDSFVRLEDLS